MEEVQGIRSKFPNKVPVIVERFQKEKQLPQLDKTKFLVPSELTMSQFVTIIRQGSKEKKQCVPQVHVNFPRGTKKNDTIDTKFRKTLKPLIKC